MDAGYISAFAALAGSAIGALASLATSWLNLASQARAARRAQDRARREALYGDFIREASRLFVDAFQHELSDPEKLVNLYALLSTLRLFAAPRTMREAERVMNRIGVAYFEPNKALRDFSNITHAGDFRKNLAANRAAYYRAVAAGPFYGFNRPGAEMDPSVVENWWRQGMMGSAKAQHDGIKAFSETDFTEDLRRIDVPTLVMHGDDDQVVPIDASARRAVQLLKHGTLKVYPGFPHGMFTTKSDIINPDLLAFIRR